MVKYYFRELKNFFRRHIRGMKNLWLYKSIIYDTREFDYGYTLDIMEFKFRKLSEYIEKHKRFVGWEFVVRDINTAVRLLNKIREDFYGCEYLDYHTSTISFEPIVASKWMQMVESDVESTLQAYFIKYPRIYKQVLKEGGLFAGEDDKTIAMNIAHINEQRCRVLFWKIVSEKITFWWD